ncbi:MAG TPA: hypothetical protein DIT01_04770, partial [Lentisphaeria bacterium]|nr:hypothetical protein [Lentisphaeria bacterium]
MTGQEIFIAGNTLSVSADATLTTDARGHAANAGGASTNGGGGGHGGRGGNGRNASNAGGFNDSTLLPNDFGGGGGSGSRSSGGRGGGRILAALAGLCEIDGTLSSNGAQGGDNSHGALGGGGAGGTIRIKCEIFDGSGLLRANGARGGQDASTGGNEDGGGGGGGGGRIVVRSKSSSFTNKAGVQAEPGGASGGFNPGSAGGRGTVVFIRIDAGATTTVDDSKADDLDLEVYRSWRWEPAVEGSFDYEKVLVRADTQVVGGGGDATIDTNLFELENSSWDTTVESTNGFATASDVTINTVDMVVTSSTIEMGNSNQWTVNSTTSYEQSGGSANAQKF